MENLEARSLIDGAKGSVPAMDIRGWGLPKESRRGMTLRVSTSNGHLKPIKLGTHPRSPLTAAFPPFTQSLYSTMTSASRSSTRSPSPAVRMQESDAKDLELGETLIHM